MYRVAHLRSRTVSAFASENRFLDHVHSAQVAASISCSNVNIFLLFPSLNRMCLSDSFPLYSTHSTPHFETFKLTLPFDRIPVSFWAWRDYNGAETNERTISVDLVPYFPLSFSIVETNLSYIIYTNTSTRELELSKIEGKESLKYSIAYTHDIQEG